MGAAALLLLAHSAANRSYALTSILGASLLAGILALYVFPDALAQAIVCAGIIALPLLDRVRFHGLVLGSSVAATGIIYANDIAARTLPLIAPSSLLQVSLLSACLVGFAGSVLLPMHPARITAQGLRRIAPRPGLLIVAGWALLCLALQPHTPLVGLMAALATLCLLRFSGDTNPLEQAGQALFAGMLISTNSAMGTSYSALALGLVACFCVVRAPIMAHNIRLDDPAQLLGAIALPSILGLLLPGLLVTAQLAAQLIALGAAIGSGLVVALIVWPCTMALVGFALPKELLTREP